MDEPLVFVHLSDIHFNKKWLDEYDLDRDLRDQLEKDVERVRKNFDSVRGILVGGDVAFGGKKEEYDVAHTWLKTLCKLVGCREQDVWCIPGNHDIDRDAFDGTLMLPDLHNTLRPADPDNIDDLIVNYLRDKMASELLFRPLENYNDFAALFSRPSRAKPLAWHEDVPLNDGSKLRIYGINSTLVCDSSDDNHKRRMIVGTLQSRPPEADDVTYLALCHHPPDWLLDYDNFINSLNSRVRVQLFGHKHFQKVDEINNCLRIGAGAVHPSRKEKNWLPRYNWLSLLVRTTKTNRTLDVDVHPRVWGESPPSFAPDYKACDGNEHRVYTLKLPPPDSTSHAPGVHADCACNARRRRGHWRDYHGCK
jgi:predicted MPP superfamily phosphohydrolase